MAAQEVVFERELNNLTKKQLIDIIIKQKLPTNVKFSDKLQQLINKIVTGEPSNIEEEYSDAMDNTNDDVNVCKNFNCLKSKLNHENCVKHIDTLDKLINCKDQQIDILNELVLTLKTKQGSVTSVGNGKQNTRPSSFQSPKLKPVASAAPPEPAESRPQNEGPKSTEPPMRKSHLRTDNICNVNKASEVTKTNVIRNVRNINREHKVSDITANKNNSNRNNKRIVIGCNKNDSIQAVPKQGYLHVYRMERNTTEENLLKYLKVTAPEINFQCELLKSTDKACSFKVNFPMDHVNKVYEPEIWPTGAAVKRFVFPKQHFLPKTTVTDPKS